MNVTMIGTGNVATVLGRMIFHAGHTIAEVIGRNKAAADILAKQLKATVSSIEKIKTGSDIYIIAVSDGAIEQLAETFHVSNKLVVHTSGTVSKNVLQYSSDKYGVLYPLQSLRKEISYIPPVPLITDGNNIETLQEVYDFAISISPNVTSAGDEERMKLHVAAVAVSNFTNHLYMLAADYCKKENLEFAYLVPLIQEVANRLVHESPEKLQTGPAIRKDFTTVEKHLDLLKDYPQLYKLYEVMTQSIVEFYGQKQ